MLEQIDQQAQRLMWEVRQQTLQLMTKKFNVAEKTSARDMVNGSKQLILPVESSVRKALAIRLMI